MTSISLRPNYGTRENPVYKYIRNRKSSCENESKNKAKTTYDFMTNSEWEDFITPCIEDTLTIKNIIMSDDGFYIAKISDEVRKCNKISDDELMVDIPDDRFSLYLHDGTYLECMCVKDSNPLQLVVRHKVNHLSYSGIERFTLDISASLLGIEKYINYIESKIQYNHMSGDYDISNNMNDFEIS